MHAIPESMCHAGMRRDASFRHAVTLMVVLYERLEIACAPDSPASNPMPAGLWSGDLTWDTAQSPVGLAVSVDDGGVVRLLDAPFYGFEVASDCVEPMSMIVLEWTRTPRSTSASP